MKKLISVFAFIIYPLSIFANTDIFYPYQDQQWLNLLHYKKSKSLINKNSSFFISKNGYKDPKSEYFATLEQLKNEISDGDNSIQCKYPARTEFIINNQPKLKIKKQICNKYQEFIKKVPIEFIEIGFASENNDTAASMMGHSFLIMTGTSNNIERKHIFGYSAVTDNINFFKFIYNGFFSGLDGFYALFPYEKYRKKYLLDDERSIWKFKLDLTKEQINKLKKHLWELKQHNIHYSLLFHNCNTATISLLKVINNSFDIDSIKPFTTPVEYLQYLSDNNKINSVSIEPTDSTRNIINNYGLNYILNAPKPARLSMAAYKNKNSSGINFNFSPTYQDIHDITNAYFNIMESKMLSITGRYSDNNLILDSIDLLKTRSILDYSLTNKFSKHIKISLENNNRSDYTRLYPTAEFGIGIGLYTKIMNLYLIPIIKYKYENKNRLYLIPEIGSISQIKNKYKFIFSYAPEISLNGTFKNNSYLSGYIGYKFFKECELFINAKYYTSLKNNYEIVFGITSHF